MKPELFLKASLAALALGLTAPSLTGEVAMAQTITSYEQRKIDDAMRSPKLADRPEIFDGSSFVDGADLREANRYMNDFTRASNRVVQTFNGLTSNAQNSPSGREFLAFVNANAEKARIMQSAWSEFETRAQAFARAEALEAEIAAAEQAAAEERERAIAEALAKRDAEALANVTPEPGIVPDTGPQVSAAPVSGHCDLPGGGDDNLAACRDFKRQVINRNQQKMQTFRAVLEGQSLGIGDASMVIEWRAFVSEVKQACEAAGPQVTQRKCGNVYFPDNEPAGWCADIQHGDKVIRTMVMTEVTRRIETLTRYNMQSVDDFLGQDGWITKEGPRTFDTLFDPASAINDNARGQIEAILAEISLTLDDVSGELAQSTGKLGELRAAALESAPQWKLPFRAGDNYSMELAASMLSRAYGGEANISMKGVWLSRTEWKIHKNALWGYRTAARFPAMRLYASMLTPKAFANCAPLPLRSRLTARVIKRRAR